MMLADSNILVYALSTTSAKYTTAQQFFLKEQHILCLAHQNILESIRVLTHPVLPNAMKSDEARIAVGAIASALTIIAPSQETYAIFIELMRKYKLISNAVFDTYLVATMLTHGVTRIATDNERNFSRYKEIAVFNPFTMRKN